MMFGLLTFAASYPLDSSWVRVLLCLAIACNTFVGASKPGDLTRKALNIVTGVTALEFGITSIPNIALPYASAFGLFYQVALLGAMVALVAVFGIASLSDSKWRDQIKLRFSKENLFRKIW